MNKFRTGVRIMATRNLEWLEEEVDRIKPDSPVTVTLEPAMNPLSEKHG